MVSSTASSRTDRLVASRPSFRRSRQADGTFAAALDDAFETDITFRI